MALFETRKRRSIVAAGAAAAVALIGLTACGSSGGSGSATGVTLNLYSDNPQWADGFAKTGAAIKTVTGNDWKSIALPSTANYTQVVQNSLSTSKPGDIIKWWSGLQIQKLAATGKLTDLTAIWDADVKKGWLNDSLKPYYTYNGKVYALPLTNANWVVYYSKSAFKKAGIAAPPTTYAEFEADAAKLKASGTTPIWTGQADQWTSFIPYMLLAGSASPDYYTKLTSNQASFGDATGKQILQTWQTWIKNGWTASPDTKFTDAPAMMKSGKVAMFPIGTWDGSGMKAAGMTPDVDYGAFLLPPAAGQQQALFNEGGALAVPTGAPNHAAAMKVMESWLDPTVQTVWSDYLGDSSPNPMVPVKDPVIAGLNKQIAAAKPVLLNRYFEALPPSLVTDSTTILDGFMVDPSNIDKVISDLVSAETKDWTAWKSGN
ncbi:hypothetical protein Back2_18320 [Nocardioides baekrokdamisoli]|uniref:Sugar ABC transporter substrate-binding protein n=1 Tax=Nocardioides baekrokdamisoli TaxID=1804624 RepID=A0A3G9IND3_9ACTN|nr:extracellular solute-binding protein [Nocardioides baekrokdamisoli]BBH17545.1 hypothetical protein Back2_18320 [Nocardioides baekrokdamisoli]